MEHFEKFASTLPDFPLLATEFEKRTEWDSTWSQTAALMRRRRSRRRRVGLLQVLEITKKLQDRHKHQWRHDSSVHFFYQKTPQYRSRRKHHSSSLQRQSRSREHWIFFLKQRNATNYRLPSPSPPRCAALPCHCTRSRDQSGGGYLKRHRHPRRYLSGYK